MYIYSMCPNTSAYGFFLAMANEVISIDMNID